METPSPEAQEVLRLCKNAAAKIMEHACSVQIFVTMHEPSMQMTRHVAHGLGNWYARESQVREWVLANEETVRAHARRLAESEEE